VQMCTVEEFCGEEPCPRGAPAEWRWDLGDGTVVFLCGPCAMPYRTIREFDDAVPIGAGCP